MSIILDNYTIPEKGKVELKAAFEIKVTAEEARRKVNRWLLEFVSTQMGGEAPTLIVGKRVVWRVPAAISFPHIGSAGIAGYIDVDVETGAMNNTPDRQAEIEKYASEIAHQQPPFKLRESSVEYLAKNIPPAKNLIITDKGEVKPES
ncbi:MAG: hypothetical protein HZC38_08330 [Chloroflexi bacterium]|nr:hypothetical protein [Chloroflexota bacterium]MBI5713410.1 hypothetical protein [Chloroflexota bacterium]